MSTPSRITSSARIPLSRERVLAGAVEVADEGGIAALTMRGLADYFGVEAMSLYYHVANKAALLDGAVDVVIGEIMAAVAELDSPEPEDDWRGALRLRILAARSVLLRHRWAPAVIEQRTTMSPAIIFYFEGVLEILHRGGFSYDLAHHSLHALGSRAIGFSQELFQPANAADGDTSAEVVEQLTQQLPHLMGMMQAISHDDPNSTIGWCDDQQEFEFGIDALLAGLEGARQRGAEPRGSTA